MTIDDPLVPIHTPASTDFVSNPAGLFVDHTHTHRCWWCEATPEYRRYHDTEWGFPVADERRLFEKICLEGFQAGFLSSTLPERKWLISLETRSKAQTTKQA